jgi:CheY-like chemotaxis protein
MPKSGPIIIVEDDVDDQELFKEIFEEIGIQNIIRFFASSIHALEYLFTTIEKPLLIISDINLPGMTGLEMRRKINDDHKLKKKGIPFIFLSTSNSTSHIAEAYEVSAQGFFIKPPSMTELKEMLLTIFTYWKICRVP